MAKDVFSLLEEQHRMVEQLLTQLADSEEGDERREMVEQLRTSLNMHMRFEEQSIYPLVRQSMDEEKAHEAQVEHDLAREGLQKLEELLTEEGFGAAVEMLKGGIGHHVEEEEGEIFPELRGKIEDSRQLELAQELAALSGEDAIEVVSSVGEAKLTASAGDLDSMTRDELYKKAQEMDVPGRSQMTKDELKQAVAQHI